MPPKWQENYRKRLARITIRERVIQAYEDGRLQVVPPDKSFVTEDGCFYLDENLNRCGKPIVAHRYCHEHVDYRKEE